MFYLRTSQSFTKEDDFPSTLSRIGIESAPDVGVHVAFLSPSMAVMTLLVEVGRLYTKKTDARVPTSQKCESWKPRNWRWKMIYPLVNSI